MAFYRQWLLILFALILGGGPLQATGTKEQRAYASAVAAFQAQMWSRADSEFTNFAAKYPESTNVPEAVLLAAQAEFKQNQFTNAIALLDRQKSSADGLADLYAYWIGEAQFQNGDFADAADTWIALAQMYPESQLRLRAVVDAAAAAGQITNWVQVDDLLGNTNGVFQRAARLDPGNQLVVDGQLSLENSMYQQHDFSAVVAVYELLTNQWQTLAQTQQCQGVYLIYRAKMQLGDFAGALAAATNLVQIAGSPTNRDWLATGWAAQGAALEQMDRLKDAVQAWQNNLTNAPVAQEREAILKIAELEIVQGQLTNAGETLTNFLNQFPEAISADIARLTAGELHLKNYAAQPAATNSLSAARDCFDQFLRMSTNSPLAGKAYLDRGWCGWLAGNMTNSLADFQAAAQSANLSPEDLAVARFKTGDALFALTHYMDALGNYRAVLDDFTNFPAVAKTLGSRALYQSLRANLQLTNYEDASNELAQILKQFPASDLAPESMLLYGEDRAAATNEAAARAVFRQFLELFPDSRLRPEVEFAIARTYELEQDWPDAIAGYQNWLDHFPASPSRPQTVYALALANAKAGNETNTFELFTNFVAQFSTNDLSPDLAPQAQWWVADYFFGQADYLDAEKNYELVYQDFPTTDLANPARVMAGRAAVARQDYKGATNYFSTVEGDTNCLMDLRLEAAYDHGNALMQMVSPDTNNPLANFSVAITNEFAPIVQLNPTNEPGARAWGKIGECEFQLANYDAATNAYAQVLNTNMQADIELRSEVQIGIGIALEKKVELATGTNQTALLELAKNNYADVLFAKNLRDDELADSFWVENAGLHAAAVAETLGEWDQAAHIYAELKKWLPQLSVSLDRKIAEADAHPPQKGN